MISEQLLPFEEVLCESLHRVQTAPQPHKLIGNSPEIKSCMVLCGNMPKLRKETVQNRN